MRVPSPDGARDLLRGVVPTPSVPGQQLIRSSGSSGPGDIAGKVSWSLRRPSRDDRVDDGPRRFHFIGPRKEGRVATQTIEQEMFIRGERCDGAGFYDATIVQDNGLQPQD
jgi:hypothetical protein